MWHERITIRAGSPGSLVRFLGWRGLLALAAGGAFVLALALVLGAVFLVLFPVILAAGAVGRWIAGRREAREPAPGVRIETWSRAIEIEPERIEILPPRRQR